MPRTRLFTEAAALLGRRHTEQARGNSTTAIHTVPRDTAKDSVAVTAGTLYLTRFTPLADLTVTKIAACSGATAWATPTLVRFGLYIINGDGTATLVAATANDATVFTTINTVYQRTLDTGGGLPASYKLLAGQQYAVGILGVGGTAGHVRGALPVNVLAQRPPAIAGTGGTALTDLPTGPVTMTTYNLLAWSDLSA